MLVCCGSVAVCIALLKCLVTSLIHMRGMAERQDMFLCGDISFLPLGEGFEVRHQMFC